MSASITAATTYSAYGIMGQVIADSGRVQKQLNTQTGQASSGYVSTQYAGLGSGTSLSLSLTPMIQHQSVFSKNIDFANNQMTVAQDAIKQFSSIASTFYAQINSVNGLDPGVVDNIAANAREALKTAAGLLDTQDGDGSYVFAGQDTTNAPIDSPDGILTTGFYTQINATVTGMGSTYTGAQINAATLAIASSNTAGVTPFSSYLSGGTATQQSIQVASGQTVSYGILANQNAHVTSTGSATTGSWSRDVLRALATLGSMTDAQLAGDQTDFNAVLSDLRSSLSGAIQAMNSDAGIMGNQQAALISQQTELSNVSDALKKQLSSAQDVDMAKTLSDLTATQNRLTASYQLIAGLQKLSLVNYL